MTIKVWIRALRLPFLTATLVPICLGCAVARYEDYGINGFAFAVTLLGIACLHLGTNLANDYYDHKTKNDEIGPKPTPVSGGSRVIQEGLIKPEVILRTSFLLFAAGSLAGLFLAYMLSSWTIVFLGVFGVFCGFFYTAAPLHIGYRGFGEFIVGLCFGPLVVFGSYFVQTLSWSSVPVLAAVPVGIHIGLVLLINEFPDKEADAAVGKKTLVVLLGKKTALRIYYAGLILSYIVIPAGILAGLFPPLTLLSWLTLPLALKIFRISKKHFQSTPDLLPANLLTIRLHLLFNLLLAAGFLLQGKAL